jgi:ATP-dependent Lhr-like helicase
MLVSTLADPRRLFADVRAVVIDEVHAFAGDDRGWHLLAVLERISRLAGRPLQRIGLSATVGNADELLAWLQGSNRLEGLNGKVIAPEVGSSAEVSMQLDFVGSEANAAKVISVLHTGEKRLVFADSRRTVETLSLQLRERGVETFVSHSSLSADVRRQAEAAFSTARDCVIVSTSTLELGIDVGDLDKVIQIGAPTSVASLLQRLGRTGRRPGTSRNMLCLATDDQQFLRACGLLLLWSEGYVEPIIPPPLPLHIAAQQLLGLTLQERRVTYGAWRDWFRGLSLAEAGDWSGIEEFLASTGHLDKDGDMLFIGPEAERKYGGIHYRDLMAVFTAEPEFLVFHGREEVGALDPMVFTRKSPEPRLVTLAGRGWAVTHVDWKRHRAYVEPSVRANDSRWHGFPQPLSYELCQAMRRVLLGDDPKGVLLTKRANQALNRLRAEYVNRVHRRYALVHQEDARVRWWTWAGAQANATIVAALAAADPQALAEDQSYGNEYVNLRGDATFGQILQTLSQFTSVGTSLPTPKPDKVALQRLKFSDLLPPEMALTTLGERLGDPRGMRKLLGFHVPKEA